MINFALTMDNIISIYNELFYHSLNVIQKLDNWYYFILIAIIHIINYMEYYHGILCYFKYKYVYKYFVFNIYDTQIKNNEYIFRDEKNAIFCIIIIINPYNISKQK